jgi:hypothetical protein
MRMNFSVVPGPRGFRREGGEAQEHVAVSLRDEWCLTECWQFLLLSVSPRRMRFDQKKCRHQTHSAISAVRSRSFGDPPLQDFDDPCD